MSRENSDQHVLDRKSGGKTVGGISEGKVFGFDRQNHHQPQPVVGILFAENVHETHDEGSGNDNELARVIESEHDELVKITKLPR